MHAYARRIEWVGCLILALVLAMSPATSYAQPLATASSFGGTYTGWPTTWKPVPSLNDPDDASATNEKIDFVGDATDPGFYYAGTADYAFFRVRVHDGTVASFSDTILILIDQVGVGTAGQPDYAFAWDSQSTNQDNHGLEMLVPNVTAATWAGSRMNDIDGNNATKVAPPDFGLTNGNGYIRILNNQSTTNFGNTTFVDFAISWNYLTTNTTLAKNQNWNIQLGSITNANDHNFIDYDVAGNLSPTDPRSFPGAIGFGPTAVEVADLGATSRSNGLAAGSYFVGLVVLMLGLLGLRLLQRRHAS